MTKNTTKAELITTISKETGLTKKSAETALATTLKAISTSLKKGKEVRLIGFGTFRVSKRSARNGRNPRTGNVIKIPASKVPTFRAGKDLKKAVNN